MYLYNLYNIISHTRLSDWLDKDTSAKAVKENTEERHKKLRKIEEISGEAIEIQSEFMKNSK